MTDLRPPLASLGRLRRDAPKTVAGVRRWGAIIDTDGALPARVKRLFVACAATMKGYRELATRELAEARAAGLTEAEAGAAIAILASVRGEGASLRFHDLFREIYPEATDPDWPDDDMIVEDGAEQDRKSKSLHPSH